LVRMIYCIPAVMTNCQTVLTSMLERPLRKRTGKCAGFIKKIV